MAEITRILEAIDEGDAHATEELLPLVYDGVSAATVRKPTVRRPFGR